MPKVLSEEEKDTNTNLYNESYSVRYTAQDTDGFWKQYEKLYFTESKNQHDLVEARLKKDMCGKNYKIIRITYQ